MRAAATVLLGLTVALGLLLPLIPSGGPPTRVSSFVAHGPIRIVGNENFTAENGVVGGLGTYDDPYVIEGWSIVDSWANSGIVVVDTDAYFVVRNVEINATNRDVEPELPRGVSFINASNAVIERVTVWLNAFAFAIGNSRNVEIRDSFAYSNWLGIGVWTSSRVHVSGNTLVGGNATSACCVGLYVESSHNVSIDGNNMSYHARGAVLVNATSTWLFHNRFLNNTVQGTDDNPDNTWDAGYPIGGNYWSDYVGVDECSGVAQDLCGVPDGFGDVPYVVDAAHVDRYPLISPYPSPPPPPLEVRISATPASGTMPLTVTFTSQVTGGVPPYGYHWTLGDGSMSPAANPVHIYLTSGDFPVWLDVYDSARADAQSNVIFVNVTGAAVNLTVSPPTAFVADADGIHASFSATVSGGTPPYAYLWDFGDGSQSTLANPDHAYAAPGIYAVTLLVTDAKGLSVTYRLVLTVAASSEVAPSEDSLWPAIGTGIAIGAGATFLGIWSLQRRARRPKV